MNHFFLLPQDRLAKNSPVGESLSFVSAKESNQRKTDPGSARKPAENQQFEALGQLARRYRRRTQTLPSLRPQTADFHRLAPTGDLVFLVVAVFSGRELKAKPTTEASCPLERAG
ncbi:hypothetical protein [Rheinheimera texasensis]|uniref:hypothetical protein n=1 Tax=Rheinheimera texasensis TaxID=306205 RepID=UPI0012FEE9AE|nr:hypothetical protein [Rheinheimera texasensis]